MNPDASWGRIVSRFEEYRQVISPALINELLRVVRQRRLTKRFGGSRGQQTAIRAVLEIVERCEVVEPRDVPRVCRDADDDKFFACAAAGHADYIVSEDEDILAIPQYEGVRTVRAADFLRILDAAGR